jgi:hypothetical protein
LKGHRPGNVFGWNQREGANRAKGAKKTVALELGDSVYPGLAAAVATTLTEKSFRRGKI